MFARLATTLAAGRRNAWRSAVLCHRDQALRNAPPARGRPVLVCRWQIDPTSGRPVCVWHAEEGSSPGEAPPPCQPVLALAASDGEPRHATAGARDNPGGEAARPRRRPTLVMAS